jgi:hypothetical protein
MNAHVRWKDRGEASFVSLTKDAVVLRSTVSSPPGSRIEGTLAGGADIAGGAHGRALVVRVKVHGCKKLAASASSASSGDFVLEGRLLDATREVRAAIAARVAAPAP